jgi:signal transduction histidine kinase
MARGVPARSTPLRLTAILIGVFTFSTLLSFAAAYIVTRNAADQALHIQVSQEFSGYFLETDQAGLEQRVLTQVATIPQRSLVLSYLGDNGRRISNVSSFPDVGEYGIVSGAQITAGGAPLSDSYLVVKGRIGAGTLIMGRSRVQVSELGEVFTSIFLISLLPTLGFAAATGFVIARTARQRVELIRTTLQDISNGNLAARVPPLAGSPDDLSQIGDSVNQMASAMTASVASLRQATTDIAHDLKTPIQRVSVHLETLEHTDTLTPTQQDIVRRASAETALIVRTFQALLQIAQIEGGADRGYDDPVDLEKVIGGIVDVYGPDAEESGQHLAFETLTPGPFVVAGERSLIGQIAANLIENSMRHGGNPARIVVSLSRTEHGIELVCADNGPGIPAEERGNVLRRLYRLERSRTSEGSGLGLSTVSAICDLHKAKLELGDNNPGLRVTVRFPLPVQQAGGQAIRPSAPDRGTRQAGGRKS